MFDWDARLATQIGVRLTGLAMITSLKEQGIWLSALMHQSAGLITGGECALAAACFPSASLGMAMLLLGTGLWKPAAVARRWQNDTTGTVITRQTKRRKIVPNGR